MLVTAAVAFVALLVVPGVGRAASVPVIVIASPVDGAAYSLDEVVPAGYSCRDGRAAITSCAGPVASGAPISTSALGIHSFAVTAASSDGGSATATARYIVNTPLYGTLAQSNSPIGFWRLGGPVGSGVLSDEAGAHSGACVNGVSFGQPGPLADGSDTGAVFPPRDGYCYVNGIAAPTGAYTLEAWVKPADGADMEIVAQGGAGQLFVKGGHLTFRQTQDNLVAATAPAPGRWSLVDATWDGVTSRLYINGRLVASGTASKAPSGSSTVYIGYGDQAPWFHGALAEVAYYPTALAADDLADRFEAGSYVAPPFDGGVQPDGRVQPSPAADDPNAPPVPDGGKKAPPDPGVDDAQMAALKAAAAQAGDGAGPPGPSAAVFGGLDQVGLGAGIASPPDATGAIGPGNYVEMVNSRVGVFDRALTLVSQANLAAFAGKPSDFVFDPQVEWDQQGGRWLYVVDDIDGLGREFLAFGWSKTANPANLTAAGWCRYAIQTSPYFDDYPKLGHSDRYVIFGTNVFAGTAGAFRTSRIWAMLKPAPGTIGACGAAPPASFWGAPGGAALATTSGPKVFTPVPVNTTDSAANGYVLAGDSPYFFATPNRIRTRFVTAGGTLGPEAQMTVPGFLVPNDVPQPSTAFKLDSGDTRLTQAVAHADPAAAAGSGEAVWTQHTVASTGGRSEVRWYELLPVSATVRQRGTISNPTNFVFDGAVSPTATGANAAIQYNAGGSSRIAEIRAQSRAASDPLGTTSGEITLGASTTFDHDFTCGAPCRWGDYAAATPDPDCANTSVVWGTNELNGPFTANPHWATRNFALDTATWTTTAAMAVPRQSHTATLLPNGKVLVAGGANFSVNALASAELFDPAGNAGAGSWTAAASMASPRSQATATLLPGGKVLLAGGNDPGGNPVSSAELYDPATDTWTSTASMITPREGHTATLLPSGKVLVIGGFGPDTGFGNARQLASAELYDPTGNAGAGSWAPAGFMSARRDFHTATLLPTGKVLVAGGYTGTVILSNADLFDPAGNAGAGSWAPAAPLPGPRYVHTATLLPSGRVLVAGGATTGNASSITTSSLLYAPATNSWSTAASMNTARYDNPATLLPSGEVLVTAGFNGTSEILTAAERYNTCHATDAWIPATPMSLARYDHTATLLPDGRVLVAGGVALLNPMSSAFITPTAEMYTPPS